jgi:hypothetical protein
VLVAACGNIWIWSGGSFQQMAQPAPRAFCSGLRIEVPFGGNHLNDGDHVAAVLTWDVDNGGCSGLVAGPVLYTSPTTYSVLPNLVGWAPTGLNDANQMLLTASPPHSIRLATGGSVIDVALGYAAVLNNGGDVAFLDDTTNMPFLYRDGIVTPLVFPSDALSTQPAGYNDLGQIAGNNMSLPARAVLLTPVPAIRTVKTPVSLTGCKSGSGSIELEFPAPPGGVKVSLASSVAEASVPSSVSFKAGVSTKTFKILTSPVTALESAQFTATIGTSEADASMTLRPIGVSALSLSPNPVIGGAAASGSVTLECAAPAGGIVVTISSSLPAVAQPASPVTVTEGSDTASFGITTAPVTATKKAAITAATSPDALTKTKKLTVNR